MDKLEFIKQGYFTFKVGDSLSQKTKEIPNGYGVYRIYANSSEGELLYIGKGGTVYTDGGFDKQPLKKRLNNTQENMRREKFFIKKMNEDEQLKALYIEWFIIDEKLFLPAYYEAALIQDYYSKYFRLPKWNKRY